MEEQKVCYDQFPPLSANCPWFIAQNLEAGDDKGEQIVFTMGDPLSDQYRCRIPQLLGKRIRGFFHGWAILSNHPLNNKWSLWNPVTCKMISLPRMVSLLPDCLDECCLTSPPGDPCSILLITTSCKPNIVFFRLDCKKKKSKWIKMSYAKQLRDITGKDGILYSLTCCNGKVYALNNCLFNRFVVHIDIAFKGREVVISLLRSWNLPIYFRLPSNYLLKGWCKELFYIKVAFDEVTKKALGVVFVSKLNMTSMEWEEMEDLKEVVFFVDLGNTASVYYSRANTLELGGYVHIRSRNGKVVHSYNVKNKTVSLSSLPSPLLPTSILSLWDNSLQCDDGDIKCRANPEQEEDKKTKTIVVSDDKGHSNKSWVKPYEENNGSHLLNIPLDVLEMITEFCVGIEYLNFRATCKRCQMAAPMIRWTLEKLQTYSLVSPWLVMFDKHQGIITFTDPLLGDKYFIKTPPDNLIGDLHIHYSRFGWLLIRKYPGLLMFFNPFTSDIRYLPWVPYLENYCFSAPPTSPNCIVAGFNISLGRNLYIHFVGQESDWRVIRLNLGGSDTPSFRFPTFYGGDLYALYNDTGLDSFVDIDNNGDYNWRHLIAKSPRNCCGCLTVQSFLTKCDKHLLLVVVSEFGESIEVFKLNDYKEWEKIDSLGRYVIYICGETCLCIEAKTLEMENKIYFPRLHNEKIVFYSLETCKYHTIDKNVQQSFGDFLETKHHLNPHAWIEPSWS